MKRFFVTLLTVIVVSFLTSFSYAQQTGGLPALQSDLQNAKTGLQGQIAGLQGQIGDLQNQINALKPGPSTIPNLDGVAFKGMSIAGYNDIVGIADMPTNNFNIIYALGADRPCRFRAELTMTGLNTFSGNIMSCHGNDSFAGTVDSSCTVSFRTASNIGFYGKITGQMLFGILKDNAFPNPQWPDGFISDIGNNCTGYGTHGPFPNSRDGILIARSIITGSDSPATPSGPGTPGTPITVPGCE